MAFENYFDKEIMAPAVDIGSQSRKFQRSIKSIKQDPYKAGVLFYLGQIQAAASAASEGDSAPAATNTQQSSEAFTQVSGY